MELRGKDLSKELRARSGAAGRCTGHELQPQAAASAAARACLVAPQSTQRGEHAAQAVRARRASLKRAHPAPRKPRSGEPCMAAWKVLSCADAVCPDARVVW
eukprot:scaffold41408_cov66-Phaeocystis_antarctica.AAC.6